MPVKITKAKGGYGVSTPSGTKATSTTRKKAKAQERIIEAKEHGWEGKK
jgi:hypothetical protein